MQKAHETNVASLALVETAFFVLILEGPAPPTLTEQAVVTCVTSHDVCAGQSVQDQREASGFGAWG